MLEAWLRRPSLEYQHAFELCASVMPQCDGPCVLRASSAFHARELLKRIGALHPAEVVVQGTGVELQEILGHLGPEAEVAQAWSAAVPHQHRGASLWAQTAGVAGLGAPGGPTAAAAMWAEPEMEDSGRVLQTLEQYLEPGGRLCVVTSGWLRRGLPEWRGDGNQPARHPAGFLRTRHWLRRASFAVDTVYGFHGPQSLAWGMLSRFPAVLGRGDWVDRCHVAMRSTYVVRGWQALAAPVAVVLARKR